MKLSGVRGNRGRGDPGDPGNRRAAPAVVSRGASIAIGLNAVIVAVTEEVPLILTVRRAEHTLAQAPAARRAAEGEAPDALPFGPLDAAGDPTLERALRGWVEEQTGLGLGYVEQLYTFGDRHRFVPEAGTGATPRVLSVAYLALMREARPSGAGEARWRAGYEFLPWEDWRSGRPAVIEDSIEPALDAWTAAAATIPARRARRERMEITFGLGGAPWDSERVLERYELLYEGGLVAEAHRDRRALASRSSGPRGAPAALGRAMAFDHRRILATALGRLRGKLRYRPVVFELLSPQFTLFQLQRVVEALAGRRIHKQNFRRVLERAGLVEGTGRLESNTGGRPAELFRFRHDVLRERPAPGVGLPGVRGPVT